MNMQTNVYHLSVKFIEIVIKKSRESPILQNEWDSSEDTERRQKGRKAERQKGRNSIQSVVYRDLD